MTYTDDNLTADYADNIMTVIDADGGRWWPSEEAAAVIDGSSDPEWTAVRICRDEPMRGEWRQ